VHLTKDAGAEDIAHVVATVAFRQMVLDLAAHPGILDLLTFASLATAR
jgi:hypothetical protein